MADLLGIAILLATAAALLCAIFTFVLIRESQRPPRNTDGYALARGYRVDPAEAGWDHETWSLDRPDGVTLPVWDVVGLDPSGPTIVMLHGWGMSKVDLLARADQWRERARRLVLYDLRGHGEASGLCPLGAGEGDDLVELLDRLGDERVVLVGHSMGATVALDAASRDAARERVIGMVLFGAYADLEASIRGRLRWQGYPWWPMLALTMAWFRAKGVRFPDLLEAAARIRCPVLIVHGENDPICSPAEAQELATTIPDAQLWNVDGGGHLDAREVDEERHDREVGAFFERL